MIRLRRLLNDFIKAQARPLVGYKSVAKVKLPKPPIPTLEHTFSRYLEYASVLAVDQQHLQKTKNHVQEFLRDGKKYQDKLYKLSDAQPNWVNCFWLPEMYLKPRYPLPLNSNPCYVFPKQQFGSDKDYLTYTATLIRGIIDFKDMIDRRRMERDFVDKEKNVPMCMDQYDRLLSSYRMPMQGEDVLLRKAPSDDEQVMVMCQNQAFTVATKIRGQLLSRCEIAHQLQQVVEMALNRHKENVVPIAGASSGERDGAAKFWTLAKKDPMNVESMNLVTDSVFCVCLDVEECPPNKTIADQGQLILHGFGKKHAGLNRWFDHTIQLVVARDGTNGLCIEHSVAEGIVIIKMAEQALRLDREMRNKKQIGESRLNVTPRPLSWRVTPEMEIVLNKQIATFEELANDLELVHVEFTDFGKDAIKSFKMSPDGFVQLAMQLVSYRMYGRLWSTYESASIRRFNLGRVDNIRSATPEALEWARAMDEPSEKVSLATKRVLLQQAAAKQARVTIENITGYGIDNHLWGLNVICAKDVNSGELPKQYEVFSDGLWTETMRFPVTTSQVTTSPEFPGAYLCYGPVVFDGHGNAYNIQQNKVIMAISARRSCSSTSAQEFGDQMVLAMRDIAALVRQENGLIH